MFHVLNSRPCASGLRPRPLQPHAVSVRRVFVVRAVAEPPKTPGSPALTGPPKPPSMQPGAPALNRPQPPPTQAPRPMLKPLQTPQQNVNRQPLPPPMPPPPAGSQAAAPPAPSRPAWSNGSTGSSRGGNGSSLPPMQPPAQQQPVAAPQQPAAPAAAPQQPAAPPMTYTPVAPPPAQQQPAPTTPGGLVPPTRSSTSAAGAPPAYANRPTPPQPAQQAAPQRPLPPMPQLPSQQQAQGPTLQRPMQPQQPPASTSSSPTAGPLPPAAPAAGLQPPAAPSAAGLSTPPAMPQLNRPAAPPQLNRPQAPQLNRPAAAPQLSRPAMPAAQPTLQPPAQRPGSPSQGAGWSTGAGAQRPASPPGAGWSGGGRGAGAMPPPPGLQRPAVPQQQQVGLNRPTLPAPPAARRTVVLPKPGGVPITQSMEEELKVAPADPEAAAEEQRPRGKMIKQGGLLVEVVEEEDVEVDESDQEVMDAIIQKPVKGGKGKAKVVKRKEKVTAEMKRKAREERAREREEKRARERKEREEIFEVGEEGLSVEQLGDMLQVDPSDLVRALFMKGIVCSMNQVLDKSTVKLVASEYDVVVLDKEEAGVTAGAKQDKERFISDEDIDELAKRPPVVTVMGHVDHGKTSLLDYIRKAKVAAGEAGGITQAIGAYNVEVEVDGEPRTICFLDTPGHEAFSAMRARGAKVTDIAIIIVAADDGVQPQTKEAVMHAQAAEVPIIVAINKIDKPGADPDRAKQGLLELNLVPEEWGGSTVMVPVSAKKGTGIDDLLTQIAWAAEEQQLVANPHRPAAGTVIEAHMDRKRGPMATVLVQAGTLKQGDIICAGAAHGKVRQLSNAAGKAISTAGPSIAVQVTGLDIVPQAGDEFQAYATDAEAREAAQRVAEGLRQMRMAEMTGGGSMVTLASLASMEEDADTLQRLNLIIKGDTSGVVEAIKAALGQLPQQSVVLRYLLNAAGDISISDVDLAAASGGMIVGFNVQPSEAVQSHAKKQGVTINTYRIIYELLDDVKAAMEGKLRTVEERVFVGNAEVKALFGKGKKQVAGCGVVEGKLVKGGVVVVTRGKQTVYEGPLTSLRRLKDTVEEVSAPLECGVACEEFYSWQEGDKIECFQVVTKARRLEEAKAATAVDLADLGIE